MEFLTPKCVVKVNGILSSFEKRREALCKAIDRTKGKMKAHVSEGPKGAKDPEPKSGQKVPKKKKKTPDEKLKAKLQEETNEAG